MGVRYVRWCVEADQFHQRYEARIMTTNFVVLRREFFRWRWVALVWAWSEANNEVAVQRKLSRKKGRRLSTKRRGGRIAI